MKLSRKGWLILVVVILAVILGSLYAVYSRQAGERHQLNDRLERAQILLPGLAANKETLQYELAHAESLLSASRAQFPESVESIEYDDDLFEIADDCNVAISTLSASPPTSKTVGAVTYSVSKFRVVVYGSIGDILDFIYELRTGHDFGLPWSAEVSGIQMNVAGGTATINLEIYGYKGG